MHIQTTRFGAVEVPEDQVLTFPRGLVGLAGSNRFALLSLDGKPDPRDPAHDAGADLAETSANPRFYWMQSLDDSNLAFLVTDPAPFFKDYVVPIREETQQDLQLADMNDGRLLVICNRAGEWLTGNLLGPLVVNTASRTGSQVVLTEKKWSCRQPLLKLPASGAEQQQKPAATQQPPARAAAA